MGEMHMHLNVGFIHILGYNISLECMQPKHCEKNKDEEISLEKKNTHTWKLKYPIKQNLDK